MSTENVYLLEGFSHHTFYWVIGFISISCMSHLWRNTWGRCKLEGSKWQAEMQTLETILFIGSCWTYLNWNTCLTSCSCFILFTLTAHILMTLCVLSVLHLKNFVAPWLRIQAGFVSTHPSIHPPLLLLLPPTFHTGIGGHWRCEIDEGALVKMSVGDHWPERERAQERVYFGVEGWQIGVAKAPFHEHWTVKWRTRHKTMAAINRLWWEASRKCLKPACIHWQRERKRKREGEWREREWQKERDIDRDEVCVTVSLGKGSQRGRERKKWM